MLCWTKLTSFFFLTMITPLYFMITAIVISTPTAFFISIFSLLILWSSQPLHDSLYNPIFFLFLSLSLPPISPRLFSLSPPKGKYQHLSQVLMGGGGQLLISFEECVSVYLRVDVFTRGLSAVRLTFKLCCVICLSGCVESEWWQNKSLMKKRLHKNKERNVS